MRRGMPTSHHRWLSVVLRYRCGSAGWTLLSGSGGLFDHQSSGAMWMRAKVEAGRGRAVALVVFLASAGLVSLPGLRGCHAVRLTPVAERGRGRELQLTTMDGRAWRLGEQRGEVVLVNLWATWCGPCREETPGLERLSEEFAGRGLRVVGVSLDGGADRMELVRQFTAAYGVTYPLAMADPLSQLDQAIEGVPTTLLFDREGRLAATYVGVVGRAGVSAGCDGAAGGALGGSAPPVCAGVRGRWRVAGRRGSAPVLGLGDPGRRELPCTSGRATRGRVARRRRGCQPSSARAREASSLR